MYILYAISVFHVGTCSAMFVFPVFMFLCCHFIVVVFRSKWYCISSRVSYFVSSVIT